MRKRRARREMARWEAETRIWAVDAARSLVYSICTGRPMKACPYNLGVVLERGEAPWVEIPARFTNESVLVGLPVEPPIRPWLITSTRIVGRLGDDQLYGWRWGDISGCRVELSAGLELISLDTRFGTQLVWTGPGVAPLAVAAIHSLYGPGALIDHPGLETFRSHRPIRNSPKPSPTSWQQSTSG